MAKAVTLTFLGDETSLQRAAKNSVKALDDVTTASDRLGEAFGKTGDGIDQKSGKVGKMLSKFGENVTEGLAKTAAKIPGIFGSAISSMPPQGQALAIAIVAGLAVSLAPLIAMALSTAILLGLGGGVLALGIKSAVEDPKVSAAFGGLSAKAKSAFKDFGEPFKAPLLRAVKLFSEVIDFLKPFAERIGKALAPLIDTLAPAVADFIKNIMPGLTDAIIASVPLFEVIAEHAPKLGKTLSEFFVKMADLAPATSEFLDDTLTVLGWIIEYVGDWIISTALLYIALKKTFKGAVQLGKDFWNWIKEIPGKVSDKFKSMASGISKAFKSAFNSVADAWNSTLGGFSFSFPGIFGAGGFSVSIPNIPKFHQGGMVPGAPGSEMLAIVQAGEKITPAGKSSNESVSVTVVLDGSVLMEAVGKSVKRNGGNVQMVLVGRAA